MKTTMKTRLGTKAFRPLCMVACLAVALPLLSQAGHPAKGSWSGDWGPTEDHRNRILLLLDWDGNEITGTINPGRNPATVQSVTFDYSDPTAWKVTMAAEGKDASGRTVSIRVDGLLENIGAYARVLRVTWVQGNEKGDFLVTRN